MIKIITNDSEKESWDLKARHPLQSWQWGEARKQMGIKVVRIADHKNVFQLTLHPIPFTRLRVGYLPRSVHPTSEVIRFLSEYGKKNNIIFIKIEPYEERSKNKLKIQNLVISKHPLFPQWTQILDLTKTKEELLESMKPKTRYNIRLAEKKGVTVKEVSDEKGFKIFSQLYFDTCRRQKYFGHTPKYHKIIWDNLKNNISHILVAYYKEAPLAAYELFHFKDTFYYPYGGSSTINRNLMAANLIMWEAIKLGKSLGASKFDMWGSLPPNFVHNHSWSGFTRFKEGYGGKFVQMIGSYDLIINSFYYKIYNLAYLFRAFFLRIGRY